MTDAFYKLPTVLILGALVLILGFLRKQNDTPTFRLWLTAWVLIFIRFALQLAYTSFGLSSPFYLAVDMGILQVSGVLFLTSVTATVDISRRRWALLICISIPVIVYSVLAANYVVSAWPYVLCLTAMGVTGAVHGFLTLPRRWSAALISVIVLLWIGCTIQVANGRVDYGYFATISMTYGLAGLLFFRRHQRKSTGVIATATGFLLWAAVAPLTYWRWQLPMGLPTFPPGALEPSLVLAMGISNFPKFIVAIGMIVTLLEDQRFAAERAKQREHELNTQLRRFADVSSHLLSGVDVPSFCTEVAELITDATNYQRVAILLTDTQHHMYVAGHSGVKPEDVDQIKAGITKAPLETFQSLCLQENRIGVNSYRTRTEKMQAIGAVWTERKFIRNPHWEPGDEILVPLRTQRGTIIGMISLDDPKDVERVTAEDLSTVEILAADLAVALENAALQAHLFQAEKLAGMGQLVAGVAHELNNPLTAVLGYTEMLVERITDATAQREIEIVRREALRMKKIIESLQRFSRQQKLERGKVKLTAVVEDVVKLKGYELLSHRIEVVTRIDPSVPEIVANEAMLNQVFMNVFTNAIEAVRSAEVKTILVETRVEGDKVLLQVTDTGPGYKDLNRVFDPFYTTKAPGTGTGLGLSICYGIVRDHGGDIVAENIHPNGACITIQLPLIAASTASAGTKESSNRSAT